MKAVYCEKKEKSPAVRRAEYEIKLWKNSLLKKSKYDDEYKYEFVCMDTAKELYEDLLRQGHSGMSINITMEFLKKLVDGKPLTALTDNEEEWGKTEYDIFKKGIKNKYYNRRYPALFKDVYEDGHIVYRDNNRVTCYDPIMETSFSMGIANLIYDEMNPIEMPYYPGESDVTMEVFSFQYDKETAEESDFDTIVVLDIIDKNSDERTSANRFFREPKEGEIPTLGGWVEIDIIELKDRIDNGTLENLDLTDLGLDKMYHEISGNKSIINTFNKEED